MSDRISLDFLGSRMAMLQDGVRGLRDSHENLADRVSALEATVTNLGNQVLRQLVFQDRRLARVDQRLDGATRRLDRLEEAQLRLADMLSDTRQEVAGAREEMRRLAAEQGHVAAEQARMAAEQARMSTAIDEVLRRLPPAAPAE